MKKFAVAALTAALAVTVAHTAFAMTFPDVDEQSWGWAKPTIESLSEYGIVKGYNDGTYKPAASVTNQEAFTLMARAIGVNAAVCEREVADSEVLYMPTADKYNIYAKKELCFMLGKNIITTDEIDEYLSDARQGLPMQRHEAAKLLTKILGGEDEANASVIFSFDYKDVDKFPIGSEKYIDYVTKHGIMTGFEGGDFAPDSPVTRAQIAVMLSRAMEKIGLDYTPASENNKQPPAPVDTEEPTETVVDYSKYESFDGAFNGASTDSEGTHVKIYDYKLGITSTVRYTLAENCIVTRNNKPTSASNLANSDWVTVYVDDNDLIVCLDARGKSDSFEGAVLNNISLSGDLVYLNFMCGDEAFYLPTDTDVLVKRNNLIKSLSDLKPGDTMNISAAYGIINSINATGESDTVVGTIKTVHISKDTQGSYILLDVDGQDQDEKIFIDTDTVIDLDSMGSTVYDLRLNYLVEVTTDSRSATKIKVTSVAPSNSLTGVVTLVNPSLKFVNLDINGKSYQIFITDDAKIVGINSVTGKKISDINEGDTLIVTGTEELGAFRATMVVIANK